MYLAGKPTEVASLAFSGFEDGLRDREVDDVSSGGVSTHGIAGRQIGHVRFRVWLKEHNVTDRDADGDAYDKRRED
jgi:hypothetical protein